MEYIVQTVALSKAYGKKLAVDGVSINVKRGAIYGLLGRNGAGKTTLLKMLLNLAKPSGGQIFLFGEQPKAANYFRIGSSLETSGFYPNLTAKENLTLITQMRGTHRDGAEAVAHALKLVGLDAKLKTRFGKFSLGMQQRLAIAAAVLHSPELLILDEPLNGLDPIGIQEMREFFVELKKSGVTLIISSHILSEIERTADYIGVMNEGKLAEEISMEELHRRNRKYTEFTVSDAAKAAFCLERNFNDIEYTVSANDKIRVYNAHDRRGEICTALSINGVAVTDIELTEESLENYFAELTGEKTGGKNYV